MRRAAVLVAAALVASAGAAHADPPPWSVGVSDADKATAQRFVDAGNARFLAGKYAEALDLYEDAVAAWNHPAIRFNIVRCLIQLDRAVDAADNLKLALQYGAAPLDDTVYAEALTYEKLLANQIGELTVACTQRDVRLTLDGRPLATCPAELTRRLPPGPHQLVGTRPDLQPRALEVVVLGGHTQRIAVELDPLASGSRIVHRWSQALPWAVFGGGFAIAGLGGALQISAASDMTTYDRYVAQNCSVRACDPDDGALASVQDLEARAERKTAVAVGLLVGGAATVATGAVLLYLNRGRAVPLDAVAPAVTPLPGGAALAVSGRF